MTTKRRKAEASKAITPKTAPKRPSASVAKPEGGARRAEENKAPSKDTRRHRRPSGKLEHLILVVDDFKDGRDLVVETLEFAGFRTIEAGDGVEALAKCQQLHPAIALMDLSLPGLDGWEVTRRLKGSAATRQIKVIALTAHAQTDALDRARQAGADDVITKPCLPNDIVERVREMLGISREEA